MVQFTTLIVSAIGLIAIATPVAAGPFAIAASAASTLLGRGDHFDISTPLWQREDSPVPNSASNGIFKNCIAKMRNGAKPKFTKDGPNKVTFYKVIPICRKAIKKYLADPANKGKEAKQGTAEIDDKTGNVVCTGLPAEIIDILDG